MHLCISISRILVISRRSIEEDLLSLLNTLTNTPVFVLYRSLYVLCIFAPGNFSLICKDPEFSNNIKTCIQFLYTPCKKGFFLKKSICKLPVCNNSINRRTDFRIFCTVP